MKKLLLALALLAPGVATHAQAPAATAATYPAAPLGQLVQKVRQPSSPAALMALAAQLGQAAAQAPTDWLPPYYQAYALVVSAFGSPDGSSAKDQLLDRAEAALAQARQRHGDASELLVLQAYIYQARLAVDPEARGQEYAPLIDETLALAKAANPANPRLYLVEANQAYYTPAEYGGGPAVAQPLYEAARTKFAAYHPASALAPSWGQDQLQRQLGTYRAATK